MPLFHTLDAHTVLREIQSSPQGLSKEEARHRIKTYGKNVLEEARINYLQLVIRQIQNPIIYILLFAAVISLILGDKKDFFVITLVMVVNTIIGFWQELKAETSTLALKKMTETKVTVLRDGAPLDIHSSDLVPGDIVLLTEGDVIGADIRLFESNDLHINESSITGESLPVEKRSEDVLKEKTPIYAYTNMLFSGTVVVKGTGTGVVVSTGTHTYLASIAQKVLEKSPDSPLTKALTQFSKKYLLLIFVLLVVIGVILYSQSYSLTDILYTLLAVMVSAVPEGLPIVLTLSLAIGSLQLARHHILTRHLPAVETLGSTTCIATDKTGTITKGILSVSHHIAKDEDALRRVAAFANESEDGLTGDPIDVALAQWMGKDYHRIRRACVEHQIHPFDPTYKYTAATVSDGHKKRIYIKGAFETLLHQSVNTKEEKARLQSEHDELAKQGVRVLCFGESHVDGGFKHWKIRIVGFIGCIDPPKDGVKESVLAAQKAGVRVIMITGDHALTAQAIASQVHIYTEGDMVLTGEQIEDMSDKELAQMLPRTSVLARIVPEHKYRIIKMLQKTHVVAMTGDGVNDVLALKVADLGIAMGSGTEAAKSTAKMVLLHDNLSVIVNAIRRGRIIADNIRKVIYYLVTTNMSQIFLILASVIGKFPFPLHPIHILWINLVTDGVQDKAFPFIKEEGNVMHRPPRRISEMLFTSDQFLHILYGTCAIGIPNLILYIYMQQRYSHTEASSVVFASMVVSQWVNGIHAQKEIEPFFKHIQKSITINPYIWLGVGVGLVLQSIVSFFLYDWFESAPLQVFHLGYIGLTALSVFFFLEAKTWMVYLSIKK